ncbi:hypothetical protein [Bradyrhizobium erythrophlei]|uniref:hypothetical protein n=1 Tax=Bradyrhizobium erythrophlei TaxID=1437360 RepID=UPI001FCD4B71|nr:hypothetical protein [Bradyrhizobium erythrophlei]
MQRGADPWQAAGYLGMSLDILLNTYGHHHPDYLSDAVEKIAKREREEDRRKPQQQFRVGTATAWIEDAVSRGLDCRCGRADDYQVHPASDDFVRGGESVSQSPLKDKALSVSKTKTHH